jgi:hypothetical protein
VVQSVETAKADEVKNKLRKIRKTKNIEILRIFFNFLLLYKNQRLN